jgi:hypothetical protein
MIKPVAGGMLELLNHFKLALNQMKISCGIGEPLEAHIIDSTVRCLTFSWPGVASILFKTSRRGLQYCRRLVIRLGSVGSMPEPIRSMAVALKPESSSNAIDLYQHHAPRPPPCTNTKCELSRLTSMYLS